MLEFMGMKFTEEGCLKFLNNYNYSKLIKHDYPEFQKIPHNKRREALIVSVTIFFQSRIQKSKKWKEIKRLLGLNTMGQSFKIMLPLLYPPIPLTTLPRSNP